MVGHGGSLWTMADHCGSLWIIPSPIMVGHGARERVDQRVAVLLIYYYYFLLTTYYLLLSARERVDQGVATGPHHVVGVEREPARHLG